MNPVFGATRHVPGTIQAPAKPTHSATSDLPTQRIRYRIRWPAADPEAMPAERFDQFGNGRWLMNG
jgi:hypothetical protein